MGINSNQSNGVNKNPANDALLKKLLEEVEVNLRNEQFGVEELAEQMNMSRSHLHRKLKQATGQSVNQFIREYRLQRAMELLRQEDKTVSEAAFQVGFGSPSYFTTCFTEYYGYPPGEVRYKLNKNVQVTSSQHGKEKRQKNVTKQIAISGLVVVGVFMVFFLYQQLAAVDTATPEAAGTPQDRSIAVLPFKNLNADQENEYFSEGVVEAINRHLSQVGDLKVISLTSTDRYREGDKSAQEIGDELKVSNLLEGSIQRYENMVRIEVRLIDATTEGQIWAENYDRELKDIFKTQSEIAENVALALRATLSPEEKAVLNQSTTENAEAYGFYLRGLYELGTYSLEGAHLAESYFKKAIALDTSYALAYTGLATTYIYRASIFGAELSALEAMALAKEPLEKALALDPELVEANTWWAAYLLQTEYDFEGAESYFKKAIATNDESALATYSDFLNFIRRHEEALAMAKRIQQINPHHPNIQMMYSLYYTGHYKEAEVFAESRLKILNNYYTLEAYGFLLLNTGQYQRAIHAFKKALDVEDTRFPRSLGWMGSAFALSGNRGKAFELIEELKAKIPVNDAGSLRFFIAVIYAALDDKTSALQWLQAAYEHHEMEMPWLISEPQFYTLHEEPEFQELVEKVGFP